MQQLNDTSCPLTVVLKRNDPHNVRSILSGCIIIFSLMSLLNNYLLGSVENLSHITSTAAAFSAHTLCRSMALNMVPYQDKILHQEEDISSTWK